MNNENLQSSGNNEKTHQSAYYQSQVTRPHYHTCSTKSLTDYRSILNSLDRRPKEEMVSISSIFNLKDSQNPFIWTLRMQSQTIVWRVKAFAHVCLNILLALAFILIDSIFRSCRGKHNLILSKAINADERASRLAAAAAQRTSVAYT